MKKLLYSISAFLLGILPQIATAAAVRPIDANTAQALFSVDPNDPSKQYLEMLFGTVGPYLHGTSGMLMGVVFKVFNVGIIVVAGSYLAWVTAKTVISAGTEGKFMGQQGKSGWLVARTVMGFGLLTPSFITGYSVIQVFIMWVVLQGIGFANTTWNHVVDYIQDQGAVMSEPTIDTSDSMNFVGTLLQMQVCMYASENMQHQNQVDVQRVNLTSPDAQPFAPYHLIETQNKSIRFPSGRGNVDNGCGEVSWDVFNGDEHKERLTRQAIILVLDGLAPAAKKIAALSTPSDEVSGSQKDALEIARNRIIGAAADWINVLKPVRSESRESAGTTGDPAALDHFFNNMRQRGWLFAGSYYYALGKLQGSSFKGARVNPIIVVGPQGFDSLNDSTNYVNFNKESMSPAYKKVDGLGSEIQSGYDRVQEAVWSAKKAMKKVVKNNKGMQIEMAGVSDNLSPYLMPMMDKINESASIMGQDSAQDPVMKLQNMGNTMIESVTIIWILVMAVATAASFAASGIPFFAFGTALTNLFLFFVPIFMAILASLFIQGSILAVYVPLIPFIVFTFTALGWFALVVETMVAGPIVCLGMTHPEGHDLLGASQQGMILLLSVFLRPVLMIIGLVAGMILSRIGLNYLDVGFMLVTNSSQSLGILTFFSMMYIYCALVMMVVHTAYGLIYQVPAKVMRWIGLSDQVGQEATETLSRATQGAQTGSQALSDFQGRGVEASKGWGGAVGKNVMDTQKESDKAHAKLQKSQQGNHAPQNPAAGGNPGLAQGAGNGNQP